MKVGIALPQAANEGGGTWGEIVAFARRAEASGIDSLWVADHFLHRAGDEQENGYHEPLTLLTALAASTERVELGPLVVATSFRSPGMLAKQAAMLDDVSGKRLILGLGCGWHEPEYRAFGYPFDHRVGRFEETLAILVPLLRGERVTYQGEWHRADDAVLLPPPVRPDLPILIAAKGDRMLRLTARFADAWQTAWFGLPDERWHDRLGRLQVACDAEGRDPATLEFTAGIVVRGGTKDVARDTTAIPLDASAIADAFAAWSRQGVGHVQLVLEATTPAAIDVVGEAIRRFRA